MYWQIDIFFFLPKLWHMIEHWMTLNPKPPCSFVKHNFSQLSQSIFLLWCTQQNYATSCMSLWEAWNHIIHMHFQYQSLMQNVLHTMLWTWHLLLIFVATSTSYLLVTLVRASSCRFRSCLARSFNNMPDLSMETSTNALTFQFEVVSL